MNDHTTFYVPPGVTIDSAVCDETIEHAIIGGVVKSLAMMREGSKLTVLSSGCIDQIPRSVLSVMDITGRGTPEKPTMVGCEAYEWRGPCDANGWKNTTWPPGVSTRGFQ